MIIKTLSRKSASGSTSQLVNYIFRYIINDKKQLNPDKSFIIKHNVHGKNIPAFVKQFEQNEANRIRKSSRDIAINHTILSWAKADTPILTDVILKNLAAKFIELRGEQNLYVGTKHEDKAHTHLHIAVSATQLNGQSSRISRQQFAELKMALQQYQQEKYPDLSSLPHHGLSKEVREQQKIAIEKALQEEKQQLAELQAIRERSEEIDKDLDVDEARSSGDEEDDTEDLSDDPLEPYSEDTPEDFTDLDDEHID